MGLIAKLLKFTRVTRGAVRVTEATVDCTSGYLVTADHYSAPGVDSAPSPADYVLMVPAPGAGKFAAAGYLDPVNAPKAGAGEMRIYARNAAGIEICEVWCKADGTIVIAGPVGAVTLMLDGSLGHWTGAVIDATGDVKTPVVPFVPGAMISLRTHTHAVPTATALSVPPAPGTTATPTPGV